MTTKTKTPPIDLTPADIRAIESGPGEVWVPMERQPPPHLDGREFRCIRGDLWGAYAVAGRAAACSSEDTIRCPYQPGSLALVREGWAPMDAYFETERDPGEEVIIGYQGSFTAISWESDNEHELDCYAIPWDEIDWRPASSMPDWAARYHLRIASVRVERQPDGEGLWCWVVGGELERRA